MKQNKKEKFKQYIEDALEQKKVRRIKKRYIILIVLLIHLLALLTIFFFLEYSPKDYFSDLFKQPAKVKFERRQQRFAQSSSQFIPDKNQQIAAQALQKVLQQDALKQAALQAKPEQVKPIEPKPLEPLRLPAYQGLNKPYMPVPEKKQEKALDQEENSGAKKLFDTRKTPQDLEKEKLEIKKAQEIPPKKEEKEPEKKETKKLKLEEEKAKQAPEEREKKEKTPEKQEKDLQESKPKKVEQIERDGLFLRKLKSLEREVEQNKLERKLFAQKSDKQKKIREKIKEVKEKEIEPIKQEDKIKVREPETCEIHKKNPRDFVIKNKSSQDAKKTQIKEYDSWKLATNNNINTSVNNSGKYRKNNDNLTLADISKGFLTYTEQQGANLVQYTNAIEGAPTEEQLKHERYIRKIFDCIETTMKIKSNTLVFNQKVDPNGLLIVTVKIILENNGKVSDMKIMESSGFAEFDRFMLNIVNSSSQGFPPVPSYLSTGKYPLPVRFLIPVQMVAARF